MLGGLPHVTSVWLTVLTVRGEDRECDWLGVLGPVQSPTLGPCTKTSNDGESPGRVPKIQGQFPITGDPPQRLSHSAP
ncbi:hypothetical protein N657DRAFT_474153 [Parathielavia appendiculata]|uniref:Uncharacterized protein n=1 Tax=Parathielavia appendiculata TaxID=2587402 RepID=A0AAN6TXU0_9PEZI|nr:hypothetical protein N657DRAFT_474153 [Parathielavia appendiculata]